eukprot:Em0010g661a
MRRNCRFKGKRSVDHSVSPLATPTNLERGSIGPCEVPVNQNAMEDAIMSSGTELCSTDINDLLHKLVAGAIVPLSGIRQFTAHRIGSVNFEFMKKVSDSLKQQLYMLLNSFGNFNMLIEEGGIKQLSTAIEDKLDVIIFNSLIEKGMAFEGPDTLLRRTCHHYFQE